MTHRLNLEDTKDPMLIFKTEKAVKREQNSSNEQVLPTPDLYVLCQNFKLILRNIISISSQ